MADPTNKLITVRPNMATTLASPMTAGDTSATFNNLGSYTVGDRVLLTVDAHNAAGVATPAARELVYGEVSAGNTLINMIRAVEGTAQAHSAGAEVIDEVTAAHLRLLHDGLDAEHTATGAHDTALVAMLAGAQTITGNKTYSGTSTFTGTVDLPNNAVVATDIAPNAIKLGHATATTAQLVVAGATIAQVSSLTTTVTIPSNSRLIEVSAYIPTITAGGAAVATISLWDGIVGTGTQIQATNIKMQDSGDTKPFFISVPVTPAAGSKTYNVGLACTTNNIQTNPTATSPAYILVKAL